MHVLHHPQGGAAMYERSCWGVMTYTYICQKVCSVHLDVVFSEGETFHHLSM